MTDREIADQILNRIIRSEYRSEFAVTDGPKEQRCWDLTWNWSSDGDSDQAIKMSGQVVEGLSEEQQHKEVERLVRAAIVMMTCNSRSPRLSVDVLI